MNHPTDNERLLADILADDAGFREALLNETVRLARRRRQFRQARRATMAVAVLVGLAILVGRNLPPRAVIVEKPDSHFKIVHTRPLSPTAFVTTQPLPANQLVASVATANNIATTANSGQFQEIGDDALLALVAPRPVVLVRLGPDLEELVFVNPEDQKGVPLN